MKYHLIAFVAGFFLDLILGDPHWLYHPVRFIGFLISFIEKKFLNKKTISSKQKRIRGTITVAIICITMIFIFGGLITLFYFFNPIAGCVLESWMTYQLLATKSLYSESMKVYKKLKSKNIVEARAALSMIVGRDTENLSEEEIAKATVETIAENTCDGVIAPMLYLAVGGPILGIFYKAVNTMDSMIGYKNEKYIDYGRCAAKMDDVLNFIPARISGLLIILSCVFLGKNYNVKNAFRIFKRDRFNHESPNSAQSESACAGALELKLAGPASYDGKIENKKFIGDDIRKIQNIDIIRANRILFSTAIIFEGLCAGLIFLAGSF